MRQGVENSAFAGVPLAQGRAACVLVHGRGQTPDYMLRAVVAPLALDGVSYVLPASGGAGWYDARAIDPITDTTLSQMNAGLDLLEGLVADIAAQRPDLPVVMVGFSQGACLLTELLLRRAPQLSGAAVLTGCRIGDHTDSRPIARLTDMPVYATCSDDDPWIPRAQFFEMLATLTGAGARLRADLFPARDHEISRGEIAVLRRMLINLIAGQPAFSEGT